MLDLEPGTAVVIVSSNGGWRLPLYSSGVVERQTAHHIVLKGSPDKWRRKDGKKVGYDYNGPEISVGPEHFAKLAEQPMRDELRRLINLVKLRDYTQIEIIAARKAFDRMEHLLRQLNEWKDA